MAGFRDLLARSLAVGTVNHKLKILRVALRQAWRDGLIDDNPADKVPTLRGPTGMSSRRAFTLDELRTLLDHADPEWEGLILFGVYTGQRQGDLVRLTRENVDLETGRLAFTTLKTGRRRILQIAAPLRCWLTGRDRPADSKAPLFPVAYSARKAISRARAAGLEPVRASPVGHFSDDAAYLTSE